MSKKYRHIHLGRRVSIMFHGWHFRGIFISDRYSNQTRRLFSGRGYLG